MPRQSPPLLLILAMAALPPLAASAGGAPPTPVPYGTLPDGTRIEQYTLRNDHGLFCKVITYGGIITELQVPDRSGRPGDVVLGCDSLAGYLRPTPYFRGADRTGRQPHRPRPLLPGRPGLLPGGQRRTQSSPRRTARIRQGGVDSPRPGKARRAPPWN